MMREIRRFQVIGEDGDAYTLVERVDVIPAPSMDNPNGTIDGMRELSLTDGRKVNFIDAETFSLVSTGMTLRVPPAAAANDR